MVANPKSFSTFVGSKQTHTTMKVYNSFTDKFGNQYGFDNYADFAKFWFAMSRKMAVSYFPDFAKLQAYAYNSKEARTKLVLS